MKFAQISFYLCLVIAGLWVGVALGNAYGQVSESPLPENVADGYAVWEQYNCDSCHTLYGVGGQYAPDLTAIYATRGETYLRDFFINPSAYHPNQRLMPRFNITENDLTELFAMLQWSSESATASIWPPRPIQVSGSGGMGAPVASGGEEASSEDNRGLVLFGQRCASCHSLVEDVIIVGPSLWGIADRASERVPGSSAEEYIRNSIIHPSEYIVEGFPDVMQSNFAEVVSSEELEALIRFLMTLEESTGA